MTPGQILATVATEYAVSEQVIRGQNPHAFNESGRYIGNAPSEYGTINISIVIDSTNGVGLQKVEKFEFSILLVDKFLEGLRERILKETGYHHSQIDMNMNGIAFPKGELPHSKAMSVRAELQVYAVHVAVMYERLQERYIGQTCDVEGTTYPFFLVLNIVEEGTGRVLP